MESEIKSTPDATHNEVATEKVKTDSEKEIEVESNGHDADLDADAKIAAYKQDAIDAENAEHNMTVLEAVRAYPMATFWAFVMSSTIIMEGYDVFLIGNFTALPAFTKKFGVESSPGKFVLTTSWQDAMQVSGQLGALIGVVLAGPIVSRIGYKYSTLGALMLLNGFIFIFYFAESLPLIFAAQILEGLPWGIFIANAPAYCSEIVPIQLRAPATQMLQMFWAFGQVIVGGIAYHYNQVQSQQAYKIPIALQWMFPTPLFILFLFAPESPWWLVRKGKLESAKKSIERLGSKSNSRETVAMMRRTVELEKSTKKPSHLELFKGTDLYRTLIVCGVYAAQNLTGNLIANQSVFFFEQAGISTNTAFALGVVTAGLQAIAVMLSWFLTPRYGRRSIYLWGSAVNTILLVALGIAGSAGGTTTVASKTRASLGLIISVLFTFAAAPASWVIIGETSAIRLRPLTTGVGRATYYVVEIPCIFLANYMLNPTSGNLGARCGYVWGSTGLICLVTAFFFLPEMKNRSYREIDILFKRKVPARKWKETVIDVEDDE